MFPLRRYLLGPSLAACVAALCAAGGAVTAARAEPAAGSWGRAIEVPGLGALNKGGNASVSEVSCASPGNCAAGGSYRDRHHHYQGFVASERHGRWGKAIEVPGLGALNGGDAAVTSVSCGAAGNCAAGGFFSLGVEGHGEIGDGFVVSERGGRWGKAVDLGPQIGDEVAEVDSVSCASAGNCLAGGSVADCYCTNSHAFVITERAGRWRSFRPVPGLWALGHIDSWINSVACPSAGNCAVGGGYTDDNGNTGGFVAAEHDGAWGTAIEVPGLATLNTGANADVSSVSCASAGSCVAGGAYADGIVPPKPAGHLHGFVAAEGNGAWGTAIQVPGLAALNKGGRNTFVTEVSCAPAGGCAAGGYYSDRSGHHQGFVAREDNGTWGDATGVPGLGALNAGGSAEVGSLSCPSPGRCATGGSYTDRSGHHQGFVTQTG